jgi:hypothetical protein
VRLKSWHYAAQVIALCGSSQDIIVRLKSWPLAILLESALRNFSQPSSLPVWSFNAVRYLSTAKPTALAVGPNN